MKTCSNAQAKRMLTHSKPWQALVCAITALALVASFATVPSQARAEEPTNTTDTILTQQTAPFSASVGTITGPVADGYTYYGMEYAPEDPNADEWGYIYPESKADLYTLTVPAQTLALDLSFTDELLAYGYDETGTYVCDGSGSVNGYDNNGQTGKTTATFSCTEGNTLPAYLWIQAPYDESWNSEFLYAIAVVYEQDDPGEDDPVQPEADVQTIFNNTTSLINNILADNGAVYGSEWWVLSAARAGQNVPASYGPSVAKKLIETNGVLHTSAGTYTNYAKTILALSSAGIDPTDIAGYNLINALSDYDAVTKQGITGAAYALLALDCHAFDIPQAAEGVTQTTREGLIEFILNAQLPTGGWAYSGTEIDPDTTSIMLEALAPYVESDAAVQQAVDTALSELSDAQLGSGGFVSWGTENSNSAAQVILALTSLGIDPQTDTRFIKDDHSVVDALCTYAVNGGGFGYSDTTYNALATQQGHLALTALNRMAAAQTAVYDMTDVNLKKVELPEEKEKPAATDTPAQQTPSTGDSMTLPFGFAILALVALAGLGGATFAWRRRQE